MRQDLLLKRDFTVDVESRHRSQRMNASYAQVFDVGQKVSR